MMRIWQLASFVWTTFQPCLQWRSTMARSMSSASMVSSPQHNPWVSKLLSIGILCYNLSILFLYVHVQLLVCMWITKASAPGNKSWYGTPLHQTLVSSTKKKKEKNCDIANDCIYLLQYTRSPTCWCTVRVEWRFMTSHRQSGYRPYPWERYIVTCGKGSHNAVVWCGTGSSHTFTLPHNAHTHRCMHCHLKVLWACAMLTILPLSSTSRNKWNKV